MAQLTTLRDVAHFDELLALSDTRPLVLFKHSASCGTSFEALDELLAHISDRPDTAQYAMLTVQDDGEISRAVTTRLGVRHETPQAILVSGRRAIWSASHFRINAAALDSALRALNL